MAAVPEVFNQPRAGFVLLPKGKKTPPIEKEWQEHPHTFDEAVEHAAKGGNIGIMAGGGFIGLDQDDPAVFEALNLPATTKWQTRPGRYGLLFMADDITEALAAIGKKPEQAQLFLYKDGKHCGEIKLQRTYQVIPPSHKYVDPDTGDTVKPEKARPEFKTPYVMVNELPPAAIKVAGILQAPGISVGTKLEEKTAKVEALLKEQQQKRVAAAVAEQKGTPGWMEQAAGRQAARERAYAEAALQDELATIHNTKEGARNDQLNRSAFNLGQFVGAGLLQESMVVSALRGAASQIGLEEGEIDRTIQSALKSGMAQPREIPKISRVTPDSPAGAIGVAPDGRVRQVKEQDGNKTLAWISDCALYIKVETRAKEATEFVFCGKGAVDGREVTFTLPAADAADNRKFRAALVNAFGAKNRVGKLNFETVQGISTNPKVIKRVEVPAWEGSTPYLPGLGTDEVEFRLSSKIPAEVYDGDLQAAKDALRKLLKVHRYAPILVAAIFGAPAIARWHRKDRFGLGLWGLTGTLKTSTVLAATCVYGPGYIDEPRLKAGQHGSTVNAAAEIFAAAGFLPQLYDNLKAVSTKDVEGYVGLIHAVLEGGEKARSKKDGGLRDAREFSCTPIITGEVRPEEAATSARVLNLNWGGANPGVLSEVQAQFDVLPVLGYHWLRFLSTKSTMPFDRTKAEEFTQKHYVNPNRLATIHGLLTGVWALLEEAFGDVIAERTADFKAALDDATQVQGAAVSEETEVAKFLSGLEELLAANPGLLQYVDGIKTISGAVIGRWMEDGIFLLPTETLNELDKIRAFTQKPSIDSLTEALDSMRLLIRDPDGVHKKYRMRLNQGNPRGWYLRWPLKGGDGNVPTGNGLGNGSGNTKNGGGRPDVPKFPLFPQKMSKCFFEGDSEENLEEVGEEKTFQQNSGNNGNNGNRYSNNKVIDIDFDSKNLFPNTFPTVPTPSSVDSSTAEDATAQDAARDQHFIEKAAEISGKSPDDTDTDTSSDKHADDSGGHGRGEVRNDPGFQTFKERISRRKCILCGRSFPYDLTRYDDKDVHGYVCTTCHMQGPPPVQESTKQEKLL